MSPASAGSQDVGMRWLFAGAGNMSASIVGGLLAAGRPAEQMLLVEPSDAAREQAATRFGTPVAASIGDATRSHAAWFSSGRCGVVLGVKPPVVEAVCAELVANELAPDCPVISIAAGVRIAAIEHWLGGSAPVVRCMPNTPSLVGRGASGLFANAHCDQDVLQEAQTIFEAIGMVVQLDTESDIDAVTALSGSGPAYFFRLVELMAASGESLGLSAATARALAIRTAEGAAAMLVAGEDPPDVLRTKVTSPGGTTAAALDRFNADGLPDTVLAAMTAARDRAIELGDELMPTQETRS